MKSGGIGGAFNSPVLCWISVVVEAFYWIKFDGIV
jgi:hypothetical protein